MNHGGHGGGGHGGGHHGGGGYHGGRRGGRPPQGMLPTGRRRGCGGCLMLPIIAVIAILVIIL